MDAQVILQTKRGYKKSICHIVLIFVLFLQIFLVTGGDYSITTEILQDKKWIVLKYGNLPLPVGYSRIVGLRLATIDNEIFSFGKI